MSAAVTTRSDAAANVSPRVLYRPVAPVFSCGGQSVYERTQTSRMPHPAAPSNERIRRSLLATGRCDRGSKCGSAAERSWICLRRRGNRGNAPVHPEGSSNHAPVEAAPQHTDVHSVDQSCGAWRISRSQERAGVRCRSSGHGRYRPDRRSGRCCCQYR
jgi:hypothetical protein